MTKNYASSFAYLGPQGTYTELALSEFIRPKTSVPCATIAEVFEKVSQAKVDAGFVPIENVIQGPVTETLDLLCDYLGKVYVENSYTRQIRHALGVLPGDPSRNDLTSIEQVMSRDTALEQCSLYLRQNLPNARHVNTSSTVAAIETVKQQKLTRVAVIGAENTLRQHGFDIVAENIADAPDNKTQFAVLRRGDISALDPAELSSGSDEDRFVTSIVINPGRDRQGLLFEILQVISFKYQINLLSIHSRPDTRGRFVFHLDLEHPRGDQKVRNCLAELTKFCTESTGETAVIGIYGTYPREPFFRSPIRTIAIIGGTGAMGKWFQKFFAGAGVQAISFDRESTKRPSDALTQADVVLLSIPMSAVADVVTGLAPHLRKGQLVVENCSIKNSALPVLKNLPEGIEVLGMHTMFGDGVDGLRNENVVFTKTERSGQIAEAFQDLFYKFGAKVSHATSEDHDTITSAVQSLLHLMLIAYAETLHTNFSDLQDLEPFSTPNFRAVLTAAQRVLGQSDDLLIALQTLNNKAPALRRQFLQSIFRLVSALEHGDTSAIEQSVRESRKRLLQR